MATRKPFPSFEDECSRFLPARSTWLPPPPSKPVSPPSEHPLIDAMGQSFGMELDFGDCAALSDEEWEERREALINKGTRAAPPPPSIRLTPS
jgi:hypothetical protein